MGFMKWRRYGLVNEAEEAATVHLSMMAPHPSKRVRGPSLQ
jgi:hypothetical protein